MSNIGIMQGRLSARPYPKLQDFPYNTWKQEFEYAQEIGFNSIEWLFKADLYKENPIWSTEGRKIINELIQKTGVKVESLCANYFLERPFFRRNGYTIKDNIIIFEELIKRASEVGVKLILLPVLEEAEITCTEDKDILCEVINDIGSKLEEYNIKIGLETELKANDYLNLVKQINHKNVGIYYDTGNCASKGYDMKADMEILKEFIFNIHIKDRLINGPSVFLGTGDTNLEEGIPYLISNSFKGDFILETYYEDDFINTAKKNYNYIKTLIR